MLNDLPGVFVVLDDVAQNLPQCLHIDLRFGGEDLCRLRVAQDGGEGLLEFVGESSRKLAQHGDAGQMGDLLLLFQRGRFGPFTLALIEHISRHFPNRSPPRRNRRTPSP